MVKHAVFFAPSHKREAREIGEHRALAIEPIKPHQRALLWNVGDNHILANGCETLSQFFPIVPVATVAETAEPLGAVRL
jgi:hypothetical protein